MSVSLVIPFSADGGARDRNWKWLRERYQRLHPDWQIVTAPGGDPWSKGRAVNAASAQASGNILVIADADVMVAPGALTDAVAALEHSAWVIPHHYVHRLTESATRAVLNGTLTLGGRAQVVRKRKGPAGGGISVTRRDDFETVGGIDPRFEGWGGEDISFARALDTLIGPHLRLDETMWHLHHEPMERRQGRPPGRASVESEKLAAEYLEANGDPVAMAGLCEQAPYRGVRGGGILVTREEVIRSIPFDSRFVGWG